MTNVKVKVRFIVAKNIDMIGRTFIVNAGATMGNIMFIAKSRIKDLNASEALFLFVGGEVIPAMHEPISLYFDKYQVDGILNIDLTKESCFGGKILSKPKKKKGEWLYSEMPSPLFNSPTSPEVRRILKKWIDDAENRKFDKTYKRKKEQNIDAVGC